ncbi:MAG: GntR family transcriptional regulator [Pseudomonadota bacterium]
MPLSDGNADIAYKLLEHSISVFRYRPGMRLSPDHISSDIRIGLTPTRTALHWLHRDGIIDHLPGQGFFVKTPSVEEIRSLYRGNMIQLVGSMVVHSESQDNISKKQDAQSAAAPTWQGFVRQGDNDVLTSMTETAFNAIATLSGSDVVIRAVETLNSRLYFIRLIECDLIDDAAGEVYALHGLLKQKQYDRLGDAIACYHETRIDNAHELADAACARALRQQAA